MLSKLLLTVSLLQTQIPSLPSLSVVPGVPQGPLFERTTFDQNNSEGVGYFYDGQPETFDPATATFTTKDELRFDQFGYGPIVIDGDTTDGDRIVRLAAPFSITSYTFLGDFDSSVLEVKKNGARHALYTHVIYWNVSEDGRRLFLVNVVKKDGVWQRMQRVVAIDTKSYTQLPLTSCTNYERSGRWSGNSLTTYGTEKNGDTVICLWKSNGAFQQQWSIPLPDDSGNGSQFITMLPRDPRTLVIETSRNEKGTSCGLLLVHTSTLERKYYTTYLNAEGCVTKSEYDLRSLRWSGGSYRYRIYTGSRWLDWVTIRSSFLRSQNTQ